MCQRFRRLERNGFAELQPRDKRLSLWSRTCTTDGTVDTQAVKVVGRGAERSTLRITNLEFAALANPGAFRRIRCQSVGNTPLVDLAKCPAGGRFFGNSPPQRLLEAAKRSERAPSQRICRLRRDRCSSRLGAGLPPIRCGNLSATTDDTRPGWRNIE